MRENLSDFWKGKRHAVGKARQAYAIAHNLNDYAGFKVEDGEAAHIAGAIAEASVAKFLSLPWSPNVGKLDGIDVGNRVEVRSRRVPGTGLELPIRPKDKTGKPHVLVHVFEGENVDIVGWEFPEDTEGRRTWNEARGIWFVRAPYRTVETLLQYYGGKSCRQSAKRNGGP